MSGMRPPVAGTPWRNANPLMLPVPQDTQIASVVPTVEPAAQRPVRRWRRRLLTSALILYFLCGALFLVVRHIVLPDIAR